MGNLIRFVLISSLAVGVFGCSRKAAVYPVAMGVVIPSRTLIKVILIDGLNSETSSVGDTFLASLAEPIVINGTTVLESGTILSGIVLDSAGSYLMNRTARIAFALTGIVHGGSTVVIATKPFSVEAASTSQPDTEVVGDGAGFAFGGKGLEIDYGPETRLNFTLRDPVGLNIVAPQPPDRSNLVSN
jgi:hypothetical protein